MQFHDFFVIKEGGICAFSFNNDGHEPGSICHDLVTPFFMAINSFADENYKERIRWIELDDGSCIYFKHLVLTGGVKVTIAGVFAEHVDGKKNAIERSVIELKWLLNKHAREFEMRCPVISEKTKGEIKEKVRLMFG